MITLLATLLLLMLFSIGQPLEVSIHPRSLNETVLSGHERIQLNCTATNPGVNISWNLNGNAIASNLYETTDLTTSTSKVSSLTLRNPTPDQSGRYSCFVPLLFVSAVATVRITAPISLLNSSPKITAFVGDSVTMLVSPFGLGRLLHQWDRNDRNKTIKVDAIGVNSTRLILPNVSFDDAGQYFFTATSPWSTNQTSVDLKVTYRTAIITEHPQNYSTLLSQPAVLHCNATSPYPITYNWQRINSSSSAPPAHATGYNTSRLYIERTQLADEGWYQCVTSVYGEESFSQPAYLTVKDLSTPDISTVIMDLQLHKVFVNWTRPALEILSSAIKLSYRLLYKTSNACVVSVCENTMCRVGKKITRRASRITFNQELYPFTNYSWWLQLTYSNNGSRVVTKSSSFSVQTSQSTSSAPENLTLLGEDFHWVNLTWSAPPCPNGIISHYCVYYNDSYQDAPAWSNYYMLNGLRAGTVYNISVAAITGEEDEEIVGNFTSIIVMTLVGAPLIQPIATSEPIVVASNNSAGTVEVHIPTVSDAKGEISFVYIIVSTDGSLRPVKSTASLAYQEASDSGLVYYVAAALSYRAYIDSNTFKLGDNRDTTGLNGQVFHNIKLGSGAKYYYFIRAYSAHYTVENGLVNSSSLFDIGNLRMPDNEDDGQDFPVVIAIAAVAGLLAVILVLVCIIICCCCCVAYKNDKNNPPERIGSRRYLIRRSQRSAKKKEADVEDTMDVKSGLTATTDSDKKHAASNNYSELLASITEKDASEYTKLHQINGSTAKPTDAGKCTSDSPCSVTSPDTAEHCNTSSTVNPALGISENKEQVITSVKLEEKELPSQATPQHVDVTDHSSPKKQSKYFNFHSKSKKATAAHTNPLFEHSSKGSEKVAYVNVTKEMTKHTGVQAEDTSGYVNVVRESNNDTTEEAVYTNVTKTAEDMPNYGNVVSVREEFSPANQNY